MGREVAAALDLGLRPKVTLLPGAPGGKALRRGDNAHVFPSRRTSPGDIAENHGGTVGFDAISAKSGGEDKAGSQPAGQGVAAPSPERVFARVSARFSCKFGCDEMIRYRDSRASWSPTQADAEKEPNSSTNEPSDSGWAEEQEAHPTWTTGVPGLTPPRFPPVPCPGPPSPARQSPGDPGCRIWGGRQRSFPLSHGSRWSLGAKRRWRKQGAAARGARAKCPPSPGCPCPPPRGCPPHLALARAICKVIKPPRQPRDYGHRLELKTRVTLI